MSNKSTLVESKQEPIPFFKPAISDDEIKRVVSTLESGWLTTGPTVKEFEQTFAQFVGAEHAVAVNSATAALHLALEAIGVGPGDEVIVPTMTFAATAEVVMHCGATPVLVDCERDTLNVDVNAAAAAVTERTKAMLPVHYGGQACDMDELLQLAEGNDFELIEDAAHAFPASYRGQTVGGISRATCFSFYANKTLTTGEGGMLTTDDTELADRARLMSLHGLSRGAWNRFGRGRGWDYDIEAAGFKYNMTDIAAAIGVEQLKWADEMLQRRQRCAQFYDALFSELREFIPLTQREDRQNAWHLYVIRIDDAKTNLSRDELVNAFDEAGIGVSVHYKPLHLHPLYRERFSYSATDFPVATDAFDKMLSLPLYPDLTTEQLSRIADTLRAVSKGRLK